MGGVLFGRRFSHLVSAKVVSAHLYFVSGSPALAAGLGLTQTILNIWIIKVGSA